MSTKSTEELQAEVNDLIKVNSKILVEHEKIEKENMILLEHKEAENKSLKSETEEVLFELKKMSNSDLNPTRGKFSFGG